jgi:hypothetical protein
MRANRVRPKGRNANTQYKMSSAEAPFLFSKDISFYFGGYF